MLQNSSNDRSVCCRRRWSPLDWSVCERSSNPNSQSICPPVILLCGITVRFCPVSDFTRQTLPTFRIIVPSLPTPSRGEEGPPEESAHCGSLMPSYPDGSHFGIWPPRTGVPRNLWQTSRFWYLGPKANLATYQSTHHTVISSHGQVVTQSSRHNSVGMRIFRVTTNVQNLGARTPKGR